MRKILFVMAVVGMLTACGQRPDPSSQQLEERKQEEMQKQGINAVGMPAIVNYSEKRMMKDILELRDKMQPTITYLVGTNNQLTKVCDSVGYGLPYATQFTNPQKKADYGSFPIAQADPNGLYSPASADGTWVLCLDKADKKVKPVYIEPRILVSPFPIQ